MSKNRERRCIPTERKQERERERRREKGIEMNRMTDLIALELIEGPARSE